uniref:C-type lectin domain-containing protein n=1 Tax=Acrobeloides nanus TaxID=290746 RepID=A0A914C4Y4_9BILA
MKEQGWFIIGVDYNDVGDLAVDMLKNISSPGMFFKITDPYGYQAEIVDAFTFANCYCTSNSQQFIIVNNTSGYGHYYADCLVSTKGGTYAQIAELACEAQTNGVLVSVTSQEKKDFLINTELPFLGSVQRFHIGLHNLNGSRYWYGYNGTNSPLGSFQDWVLGFSASSTGDCVFYDQYDGRNWGWETGPCMGANPFPYVCQFQACDADNYCYLSFFDFTKEKDIHL